MEITVHTTKKVVLYTNNITDIVREFLIKEGHFNTETDNRLIIRLVDNELPIGNIVAEWNRVDENNN